MELWLIFMAIVFCIFIVSCISVIIFLSNECKKYDEKLKQQYIEIEKFKRRNNLSSVEEQPDRLQYTLDLFSFIDKLVLEEVTNVLKFDMVLGEKYNISNLNKDIERVSEKVYKQISSSIFTNNYTIVTPAAIFSHISSSVSTELFAFVQKNRDG